MSKEYRLRWNPDTLEILNSRDYKEKCTGTTEFYDTFYQGAEFDTIGEMQKFIKKNNLIVNVDEGTEIDPFDSEWDKENKKANIRMFIDAINAMRLSIEQPEFVMFLKQRNIKLIVDENYGGTWAYLEEIEEEHKVFLEADRSQGGYNAKFEYK